MAILSSSQLLEALNWRYATKKFDPTRKIPADLWATLEQSLVLTPSSFGLQPWKFIVVNNPELRAKLVPASWNQTQVAEASHLVVFTLKKDIDAGHVKHFLEQQVAARGGSLDQLKAYRDIIEGSIAGAAQAGTLNGWQGNQVYIALGQFMLTAALLGVDACPMEGIDRAQYDSILGLTGTNYTTLAVCPVGYRAADDKYATAKKVRFPASEVIQHL